MGKFKAWLSAARLRTLPLSISGILVGTALASSEGFENKQIFLLTILTTITFQVTSNFANDYGDGVKGTDADDRVGPQRALQSGALDKGELLAGIIISAALSFCLTVLLVYTAFGIENLRHIILYMVLGILSIWAALKYTMGSSPYGYQGLGDVFVFIFFGILAVLGTKFLYTKTIDFLDILPAMTIGLLSTGVLNLNNLRDVVSDQNHGKNTVVVKMGFEKGKKYHYALLITAFLCWLFGVFFSKYGWEAWISLLFFTPVLLHLLKVVRTKVPASLDPELKKLALSTFAVALSFYLAINYFL
ncbi:1,4-dihydroxy-2-naphthoate octaprenyltransferase [uncultured Croceitalea sp.]|uniref:1,4-dihydroxy-2-naphthoate octaprenyltransferase n=1 Tax=uncultured Croceitalea sp. TaxID=1798908 RepID=UPI0033058D60